MKIPRICKEQSSSTNVIQWGVIEQLEMMGELTPSAKVLSGFNKADETTKGEIILSVNARGVIKNIRFYVVKGGIECNAIFGGPWIHDMKAVPSTQHKQIEFPTSDGIGCIQGTISGRKNIRHQDCCGKWSETNES
ncbi:uncharacterized protein LOC132053705 [Lycium ferocissimum]|uniref:uncharacterized protein LOC132053705 n=1 Tax=Lycium ferocissimum TaxID=112874 RepID=UPI002816172C|nr:uncharacterized protein LOC132053705 [Lycium ferocissimum]